MTEPVRRTLTGLAPRAARDKGVGRLIRANRQDAPVAPAAAEPARAAGAPAASTPEQTESGTHRVPKYLQLRRREARVYDEQADALTVLARRLNNGRQSPDGKTTGERITDNTLLRLAIDLLLARADELEGTTEEELAASLGLEPRRLGTEPK
ncbi:hypothetical protein LVY72_04160 [Arthrobacter sp. I2-34]|uniref:Uncharacterized protein n=1 Tax=Arthrobacter hankyongi TaxID=2904801 RepID=A0ABS9L391_9MICC|nr:hypothetical protein [Arthrobacter hankyongi]MCG2621107.1 hypothetical protein [Arthrobacter hankyongi]